MSNPLAVERLELDKIETTHQSGGEPLVKRDMALVGHVSVRLAAVVGELELSLDDLFAMRPGSVLTLEQSLEAPVLLQVNGKAIAEAELVAVEDRFGVRITRVME